MTGPLPLPYRPYREAADSESKSLPPSPILICAKCGEDLTGHGTVEMGGKIFCAKPGCGYPARGEAGS